MDARREPTHFAEIESLLRGRGFLPQEELVFRRSSNSLINYVSIILGEGVRAGRLMPRLSIHVAAAVAPLGEILVVARDLHQLGNELGPSEWYAFTGVSSEERARMLSHLEMHGLPWFARYETVERLTEGVERADFRMYRIEKSLRFGRRRIETITKPATESDSRALSYLYETQGNLVEALKHWRAVEPIARRSSPKNLAAWEERALDLTSRL